MLTMLKFLKKIRNLFFRSIYTSRDTGPIDSACPKILGSLTKEQLHGIFRVLPIDLSFVDEKNLNRFVLLGHEPVFDRDEGIIGIPVRDCHNDQSRPMVDQILDDFRSGKQNACDFWMTHKGRFVHIKYLAVRNHDGKYLGTLEFIYDGTKTRSLEGARHELIYD